MYSVSYRCNPNTSNPYWVYKQPNPNIHIFYPVYKKRNYSAGLFGFGTFLRKGFLYLEKMKILLFIFNSCPVHHENQILTTHICKDTTIWEEGPLKSEENLQE